MTTFLFCFFIATAQAGEHPVRSVNPSVLARQRQATEKYGAIIEKKNAKKEKKLRKKKGS